MDCRNEDEGDVIGDVEPVAYVEGVDINFRASPHSNNSNNNNNNNNNNNQRIRFNNSTSDANNSDSTDNETSFENVVERIEDRRFSCADLRSGGGGGVSDSSVGLLRGAVSEGNLLIKGGINKFKTKIEDKVRSVGGKICKECFIQSIQLQLNRLGIVDGPNNDMTEAAEQGGSGSSCGQNNKHSCANNRRRKTSEDDNNSSSDDDDGQGKNTAAGQGSNLLKSLHRRTLTEIDWHELTRFAQGEVFDPESSTAREIRRVIEEGKDELSVAFKMMHQVEYQMEYVVEEAEKCVQCVLNTGWRVVSHWELPQWLRDNDFLWHMHRPQLPSLKECFCSMFRIHTETGNIWTHFAGLILIVIAMLVVYLRPYSSEDIVVDYPRGVEENFVFTAFFIGAICCLGFSWLYHTCACHSKKASSLLSKLDYAGIAFMIMGSFTPCIYYGFYCHYYHKIVYLTCETVLGVSSIIVALWDKFATPAFRAIRAGVFLALGCSGIIPIIHMMIIYGVQRGSQQGAVGWLIVMGLSYIIGAILYALRVPERFFPGKCNLVFQSHQIFHVLVVLGAMLHLHGCCEMAAYRVKIGRNCSNENAIFPFVPTQSTFPTINTLV